MKKEEINIEDILVQNIRKAMADRDLRQIELAEKADISEKALSKILAGQQRLSIYYLSKIAKAFSIREIDMFTYPDIFVKADGTDNSPTEVLLQLRLTKEKKEQVLKLVFGENNIEILNK